MADRDVVPPPPPTYSSSQDGQPRSGETAGPRKASPFVARCRPSTELFPSFPQATSTATRTTLVTREALGPDRPAGYPPRVGIGADANHAGTTVDDPAASLEESPFS